MRMRASISATQPSDRAMLPLPPLRPRLAMLSRMAMVSGLATAALLAVALAGCAREDAPGPAADVAPFPAADAAPAASAARFAYLLGEDTVAVERFARDADQLTGEMTDRTQGTRVTYVATLGAGGRIERLEIEAYAPAVAEPALRAVVEMRGDTLVAEWIEGDERSAEQLEMPPDVMLYLNPSIAMIELMLERVRTVQAPLRLLSLSAGDDPRLVEPTVTLEADSAGFSIPGGADLRMRIDGTRILSGATGEIRFVRID